MSLLALTVIGLCRLTGELVSCMIRDLMVGPHKDNHAMHERAIGDTKATSPFLTSPIYRLCKGDYYALQVQYLENTSSHAPPPPTSLTCRGIFLFIRFLSFSCRHSPLSSLVQP